MGIARTFQNLALFKGMSVLDNIMTGRNLRMHSATCCCRRCTDRAGREREEIAHREAVELHHRFPRDPGLPQDAGGAPAVRAAKARGPGPRPRDGPAACCCWTSRWPA